MARQRPQVRIYTRVGCGLCVAAEHLVAREARRRVPGAPRVVVEVVDVDANEDLVRRYGVRVPVVEVDGLEVAELEVTPGQVRRALRSARRRRG